MHGQAARHHTDGEAARLARPRAGGWAVQGPSLSVQQPAHLARASIVSLQQARGTARHGPGCVLLVWANPHRAPVSTWQM